MRMRATECELPLALEHPAALVPRSEMLYDHALVYSKRPIWEDIMSLKNIDKEGVTRAKFDVAKRMAIATFWVLENKNWSYILGEANIK